MSRRSPDFDDLVGTDLPSKERERLLRVHRLLIEAGPPPDVQEPAHVVELQPRRRRRRIAVGALAATLAVAAAFAIGILVGDRMAGPSADFEVTMQGTSAAPSASATLTVFQLDDAGNWPMEMTVAGLPASSGGRPYQLWLTKDGKPIELCGAFQTSTDGSAVVPMNAPYDFREFDGWVVVEEGASDPLLTT